MMVVKRLDLLKRMLEARIEPEHIMNTGGRIERAAKAVNEHLYGSSPHVVNDLIELIVSLFVLLQKVSECASLSPDDIFYILLEEGLLREESLMDYSWDWSVKIDDIKYGLDRPRGFHKD